MEKTIDEYINKYNVEGTSEEAYRALEICSELYDDIEISFEKLNEEIDLWDHIEKMSSEDKKDVKQIAKTQTLGLLARVDELREKIHMFIFNTKKYLAIMLMRAIQSGQSKLYEEQKSKIPKLLKINGDRKIRYFFIPNGRKDSAETFSKTFKKVEKIINITAQRQKKVSDFLKKNPNMNEFGIMERKINEEIEKAERDLYFGSSGFNLGLRKGKVDLTIKKMGLRWVYNSPKIKRRFFHIKEQFSPDSFKILSRQSLNDISVFTTILQKTNSIFREQMDKVRMDPDVIKPVKRMLRTQSEILLSRAKSHYFTLLRIMHFYFSERNFAFRVLKKISKIKKRRS